jgi:hypothetical protein
MVNREKGAVTVLATEPAKPPQNNCFIASFDRDDDDDDDDVIGVFGSVVS